MPKASRLLDTIKPERYRLDLDVDLEKFQFDGQETIEFELLKDSPQLVFHAYGLEVKSASLAGEPAKSVSFDKDPQTLSLDFGKTLPAGKYTIEIDYTGQLDDKLHGFYRSSYVKDGQKKYLATTQLEAIHAREALVCIDEPAAKAVFETTITADAKYTAISNTDAEEVSESNGKRTSKFEPTPKMSTYLLAFIVGELEYVESRTKEGVTVRTYTIPGKKAEGKFAADMAAKMLSFYTDYFGIPYPLPKLDMAAIPDFASAAMENWGLVTYRETELLLDEKNSSLEDQERIAVVIGHELAHQWFGNLVTMGWWTDLWLNEGFAAWCEALSIDPFFPEWQMWVQFVAGRYSGGLGLDGLASTHPIEVEIEDAKKIDEIFDAVSYAKGASVIRMLQQYIGPEVFQKGLRDYLKKHSYGNTKTTDLWQALEDSSDQPIQKVMSAWTSQPGYPVVSWSKIGDKLELKQERFFASPREAEKDRKDQVWPIPLSCATPSGTTRPVLFEQRKQVIEADTGDSWIKINPGQSGFYRVLYSAEQLDKLAAALSNQELSSIDRYGVINDLLALTEAGYLQSDLFLKLITSLNNEQDYTVWRGLAGAFRAFAALLDGKQREQMEQITVKAMSQNLQRLGWEKHQGEAYFDSLLRPLLIGIAGLYGHRPTVEKAQELFAQADSRPIDPDLREDVYATAARAGDDSVYNELLRRYQAAENEQEKEKLLRALAYFKQPELIKRTLDYSLSAEVRSQDTVFVIAYSASNRYGSEMAWEFVKQQWPELLKRYGDGGHMLTYLPKAAVGVFHSHDKADEAEAFFKANPHPAITRSAAQAVEAIRLKADWYQRDKDKIEQFIANLKD